MGALGWLGVVVSCAFVTACVESNALVCGERVCPADSTCDAETSLCIPNGCGDNVVGGTEECDGTDLGGRDCTFYGYYTAGTLECSRVCTYVEESCRDAQICGDHIVNGDELCDGAPPANRTCTDFGQAIGRLGCNEACSPSLEFCDTVGWHVTATDHVTPWRGIWGASETAIFAVGDYGRVFRFDGTDWKAGGTSTMAQLNHVWGTSATDVFAVGDGGAITHFDGSAWTTMASGTTQNLRGVWGRAPNDVYVVGDAGVILHYNGSTWALEQFPPHDLNAVYGNATTVIAVGNATGPSALRSRILRKEMGGAWAVETNTALPTVPNITESQGKYTLLALWGVGNDFFAVGGEFSLNNGRSVMLHFDDSTDVWTAIPLASYGELQAVFGTSATDLVLGGHNGLMLRWDGVEHQVIVDESRPFSELWGTSTRRLWTSSYAGSIYTTDGLEWRVPQTVSTAPRDLKDVHRFPNGDLIVVGASSQVIVVSDGAAVPVTVPAGITRDVTAVWAIGDTPATAHNYITTEGDGLWYRAPNASDFVLAFDGFMLDVFGVSDTKVWAVGGTVGVPIVKYLDGAVWSDATLPAGSGLRPQAVWASGPNDVFVVGNAGVVVHSSDGVTFTQMATGVDPSIVLRDVWGTGPTDVYVSGDNGVIIHYDGTAWHRMTYDGTEVLLSLVGTSAHDIYASGTGSLLHYDGISWSTMQLPVPFNTTGAVADANGVVFTGFLGRILQLDRVCQPREEQCGDAWDNDCDGKINCADIDCMGTAACRRGGACKVEPTAIGCNESRRISTFTGVSRKDEWSCAATSLGGSEVTLRFNAPASGQVTFEVTDLLGDAQLLALDADTVETACDVTSCEAATNGSITRTAAGTPMFLVVDAPAGEGAELTLTTSCN